MALAAGLCCAIAAKAPAFEPMLPNAKWTPGKVATRAADHRGVTPEMRDEVFARYRIPDARRSSYVIDHLIPKELGGADVIENLWPQKINARPYTAERKAILTRTLLTLIASGQMPLAEAQREVREDWISSFIIHVGMVYLSPAAAMPKR